MKQSEIVKKIREEVVNCPIVLQKEEGEKTTILDPKEELINKAFLKICDIWNNTPQSRNFLRHLIQSYLPIDYTQRVLNFGDDIISKDNNRCCILGIKLAGVRSIADGLGKFQVEKAAVLAKAGAEGRKELTKQEQYKLKKMFYALPVEVQNATTALSSEKSYKFLSTEAGLALERFVEMCILANEKDVRFTVYAIQKKEREDRKAEVKANVRKQNNIRHSFAMASMLDDETISKLSEKIR